jgi:hypothetical protein
MINKFLSYLSDTLHPKRRRTASSKAWEVELEQEEHSLSLSQHSSPSQSDQEQTPLKKPTDPISVANLTIVLQVSRKSSEIWPKELDRMFNF